jgi:PAS domain S-box-containing protein
VIFRKIHHLIPFNKLLKLVLGMAVVLQIIVITYNHFSGYHELSDFTAFVLRVIRGIIYSTIAGFAIAYPDLFVIKYLNKFFKWQQGALIRAIVQFVCMLLIAITISSILTTVAHWISRYPQGLTNVLFNNALIYSVVNAFFMSILEAWIYLDASTKEKVRAELLQEELLIEASSRARYEAQIQIETEKNLFAQKLISQEKTLNHHLENEIQKREVITRQLKESREQLNSILTNLAGAAYRCYFDEQYTMKYISEKIFDISGYHASELIENADTSFAKLIHPDDLELCRNTIADAASNNRHYEFEYRIIHKKGHVVWVNENGKGIYNQQGKLEFLDGIILDISRSKTAEFAAAESERNYKELMDLLPQPIFELDMKGNILFVNNAGKAFFGIEMPENPQEKISALDFMVQEDVPRVQQVIKNARDADQSDPNEYTVIRPDGSLCPVLIYESPIVRNNRTVGRRGLIIDISERKKQELKIVEAKEALERINNNLEQSIAERTKQLTEANTQLLKMQKEHLQSQFEVLKQQVNPHFLFNSLNVLSSLIKIDPDLAELFTERLSKVYRYVLENKEKDLVSLSTELEFLKAYLFLLEIRFMKKLFIQINIDKACHDLLILPIAIQLIIENAIKHNTFSKVHPLKIEMYVDEQLQLNIVNSLNLRETKFVSTGVGLENIKRRYALVSDQKPEFIKTATHFIAILPLLKPEKTETE